ncbi:CPBP family intramembrane glutamic endopeptidase [Sinomicrobium sp. M5D2P9]
MDKINTKNNLAPVIRFLAINFALSGIFYFFIIYSGKLGAGEGLFVTGLMWCPGIAALIAMKLENRNLSELGWRWGKTKYQLQSFLVPVLYALIAYLIIWFTGLGGFYDREFVSELTESFGLGNIGDGWTIGLYVILIGIFGTVRSAANALGEEIGWRGYLVPELFTRYGFTRTSLISGFIWAVWHLPILLFADYNSGTPGWYAMICFFVLVLSAGFIFTWYRMKSGSLWTSVILHASHNLFIQAIFTPLTIKHENTAYFIDEFGAVLPLVTLGFAVYFWRKRKELGENRGYSVI